MNQLIKAWRECQLDKAPFKFPTDNVSGDTYSSYNEYIGSGDFGYSSPKFQLGLIPQPYIGDLSSARVFVLMLNPGFSPGDYYAQEYSSAFRQARFANLRQENIASEYPFFYLNPAFAWTAGGQWWQSKLHTVITQISKHDRLLINGTTPYLAAMQHVSKHLACLELCPYFSKTYTSSGKILHSSESLLTYVHTELKHRCDSGQAAAIVLRQAKQWDLPTSSRIHWLASNQARGAHLTIGTAAGDFMYQQLVELLEKPEPLR